MKSLLWNTGNYATPIPEGMFRHLSFRSCAHAHLVWSLMPPSCATDRIVNSQHAIVGLRFYQYAPLLLLIIAQSFFCVCYAPDLVGALTGIQMNSVSRWHHWFPRRYSQEGCARVDPGFVNADAILPLAQ